MSTAVPAPASGAHPGGKTAPKPGFQRLSWWQQGWRLASAWLLGGFFFVFAFVISPPGRGETDYPMSVDAFIFLDLLVGQLAVLLAAVRRRWPLVIALSTILLTSVSAFAMPAALLATISLATRRRLVPLLVVGVAGLGAGVVYEGVVAPELQLSGTATGLSNQWLNLGIIVVVGLLSYGICALVGWNIGVRRELVESWRSQAQTAHSEQAARVAQAQLAERAQIAREMHDVLAHRLSLVAMHAGVLAHRVDLPEAQRREAAEVVRTGAHQALEELREVLGVLRTEEGADPQARTGPPIEAPQPGLSDIPALVAEVTDSGQDVTLTAGPELWPRSVQLPASTGRHAYRVVQEALTNARKHTPGSPVAVWLHGRAGDGLQVVVTNPVTASGVGLPPGGRGLTGMAERVQLAGGRFRAGVEGGDFIVRVWLPWPRGGKA